MKAYILTEQQAAQIKAALEMGYEEEKLDSAHYDCSEQPMQQARTEAAALIDAYAKRIPREVAVVHTHDSMWRDGY